MFVSPFAGRYDDILSGYFQRSIMDNFDLSVTYGIPLMKQDRNPHNIFDDMSKEILGGKCADEICKYLQDFKYSGSSITDCYSELVDQTIKDIDQFPSKDFLLKILEGMRIWSESFNKIMDVILEFCQNHNGKKDVLERMLDEAAELGVKYVKLQAAYADDISFRPEFENGLEKDSQIVTIKDLTKKNMIV